MSIDGAPLDLRCAWGASENVAGGAGDLDGPGLLCVPYGGLVYGSACRLFGASSAGVKESSSLTEAPETETPAEE